MAALALAPPGSQLTLVPFQAWTRKTKQLLKLSGAAALMLAVLSVGAFGVFLVLRSASTGGNTTRSDPARIGEVLTDSGGEASVSVSSCELIEPTLVRATGQLQNLTEEPRPFLVSVVVEDLTGDSLGRGAEVVDDLKGDEPISWMIEVPLESAPAGTPACQADVPESRPD